jgi:hypothetical protein
VVTAVTLVCFLFVVVVVGGGGGGGGDVLKLNILVLLL